MKSYVLVMKKAILIVSVFLLFFVTGAVGATYYVAPTGSDNNSGTRTAPFSSIQKAANVVNAGDTVIVRDGVYTASSGRDRLLNIARSGTAGSWITFKAENPHGAILDGKNYSTSYGVVFYSNSYVKLEGFEIRRFGEHGILGSTAHDISVYNNHINDISRYKVSSCSDSVGRTGGYTNPYCYNFTWERNLITDIGRLSSSCQEHAYRHDHGLYLQGKYHLIRNNIFYNMYAGWGIKVDGWKGTAPTKSTHIITNNTFAFSSNPGPVARGHIRFYSNYSGSKPKDVIVQNNIFYNPPGNTAVSISVNSNSLFEGSIIRNNITTSSYMYSENLGSSVTQYVSASNNQLSKNSLLFDPDNKDFRLSSNSPAIGSGYSEGLPSYDFDGNPRSGRDIGAYAYQYDEPLDQDISSPQNFRKISQAK